MAGEIVALVSVIALFVILPAIIFHHVTKWKTMKQQSKTDENGNFHELRVMADKLDERTRTLERILDDEVPDWRSRYHDR